MEGQIAQFMSITDCTQQKAESYLKVSDYDLEQALQLFFDTGGADMEASTPAPFVTSPFPTRPPFGTDPIDDDATDIEDEDMREAMRASEQNPPARPAGRGVGSFEDDEAMARRLQEELYGTASGEASGGVENGVRAPIAKTMETLVDEGDFEFPPPRAVRGGQYSSRPSGPREADWD